VTVKTLLCGLVLGARASEILCGLLRERFGVKSVGRIPVRYQDTEAEYLITVNDVRFPEAKVKTILAYTQGVVAALRVLSYTTTNDHCFPQRADEWGVVR
jgi:hypothetical protein